MLINVQPLSGLSGIYRHSTGVAPLQILVDLLFSHVFSSSHYIATNTYTAFTNDDKSTQLPNRLQASSVSCQCEAPNQPEITCAPKQDSEESPCGQASTSGDIKGMCLMTD